MPGLIDTHVHLVADSAFGALDRVAGYTDDEIDAVVSEGLRRQLAAGVTTVRDLGDRRFCVVDRRDRQRSGAASGPEPTILAAGPPITSRSCSRSSVTHSLTTSGTRPRARCRPDRST